MSRFTETLAQHYRETITDGGLEGSLPGHFIIDCHCGAELHAQIPPRGHDELAVIEQALAAHVESMLVEAGVVAVELPEARGAEGRRWDDGTEEPEWSVVMFPPVIGRQPIMELWTASDGQLFPDEAKSLAAALLAAAVRPVTPEEPK